ncbi:hypothetical protein Tco_1463852 [Tanacetum coccineum]
MNIELVKGSKTKVEGSELEQEKAKKQKGDDDQEEAEMKRHIEIVKDDEVAIGAIPLATKPLVIVEYQIDKDGRMGYFKLIRVDRSSKRYSSMIKMLQNIDGEDLETLWKLVKAKHGNTRPEDDYERVFWGDLKIQKMNIKFRGGLLGFKDFKMILRVNTAQITTAWKRFYCQVDKDKRKDWRTRILMKIRSTQSWLMSLASSADKPSKTFDELMSIPIDFSAYIMNGLKITNLTQETLIGLAFKLLKGTRTNYAELEYDFEECYKALSKKLD